MMNAAAPKRDAPAAALLRKILLTLPAPPCLGEALRRVTSNNILTLRGKYQQRPGFSICLNHPEATADKVSTYDQNIKRKFFIIKSRKDINSDIFVKDTSTFVVHLVEIFRKLA